MKTILLFLILLLIGNHKAYSNCGERYVDAAFSFSTHKDIQYGSNYKSNNQLQNLILDIYEPQDDTSALRPLIIFVHGGSFVGGSRMDQRIDLTAQHFAKKGYVTANIEYRVEQNVLITPFLNFILQDNWYKAMIRASHDLKAAIRFIKKDVAVNGNTYRIDTSNIFVYGSSAGAITALNTIFIDDTTDMTAPYKRNIDEMGGLEGNSGNPGYSSSGVKAIVSCSGAFDNVEALNNNTNIAYIGFHNNPDLTVPFEVGCFTTVFCHLGTFYGDKRIFQKAQSLNMLSEFYPFNFLNHPVDSYNDTATHALILEKTTNFLANLLCNNIINSVKNNQIVKNLEIFPNPAQTDFYLQLPENTMIVDATIKIYSIEGKIVYSSRSSVKSTLHIQPNLNNGLYFVEIQSNNTINETIYLGKLSVVSH